MSTASDTPPGAATIERYLTELPNGPGVYRFLDAEGNALYVGKAKNLKKRVAAYTRPAALGIRLQRMVAQVASLETAMTRSEAEALLLEANMTRKLMPRYNILLRDDKSFPFILFTGDHDFPRVAKHRGPKTKKGRYFGPFVSGLAVNETLALLQKAFLLRPCADTVFKNRTRPCLQYQIKRCSAPCVGKIGKDAYGELAGQAEAFLSGKSRQVQEALIAQMQELSLKLEYEKASVLRDRLKALTQVQRESLQATGIADADVIAMAREGNACCIQLFSFRGGANYGNRAWFPAHTQHSADGEILEAFIGQFYQAQTPPPLVLISHPLEEAAVIEEALALRTDYKVEIVTPLRGSKRDAVEQALTNAREGLRRHVALNAGHRELLLQVQTLFGLEEPPERIEVYDNSHTMGANAVGGMVVAGPEGFIKPAYRRFTIKMDDLAPGDDYAMLRQVLVRRFKRLQSEEDARDLAWPDLVLIDGGAGHLTVAAKVFEELGIGRVPFATIAKGPDRNAGREWLHLPQQAPFQLPPDDPALHYLQRLRDEAHRYAIGFHRAKRGKAQRASALDAIPMIGPARKRALLLHFGSAKALSGASLAEIEKVPGIDKHIARVIYGHFHG